MLGRSPSIQDQPKVFACSSCTRRKVRCDKQQPTCSTCQRLKLECIYTEPVARKRKREPDVQKLEHYERILKEHKLLDTEPPQEHPQVGRLISNSGNHRYVESTLWRSFGQPEELAQDFDEASPSTLYAGALLGMPQPSRDLNEHHPSQQDANTLWEIFKDRVDPIVKVLHIPTVAPLMAQQIYTAQEECLVFAIYFFAVSTITEAECMQILKQDRTFLATLYRDCLNQALLNADFLRTTNIMVVQALVLLLLVTRGRTDAQLFWMLVGVAIRIAQRMGLHRDGSLTGLRPFDTEIHRRLFWQLPSLEGFAGQFAGIGASTLDTMFWDTKQPLNINDVDIWPGMTDPPVETKGATEMLFLRVRSSFSSFYKNFAADLRALDHSQDEQLLAKAEAKINEIEDILESQYLRYCDPMDPVHFCTSLMARVAVQASRFRIRMPWAKAGLMSPEESRKQHDLAIQVLDRFIVSQTNPMLSKFHAHTNSFVIWDILVFSINHLQKSPDGEQDPIWSRLEILYRCQAHLLSLRLPIAVALTKHVLRAWDATGGKQEPAFITKLRAELAARTPPQDPPVDPMITMDDVNSFDWAFWDQLIKDPDSLAVGTL